MRDSRLTGLDFLRALACLMVFGQHTFQRLNPAAYPGTGIGLTVCQRIVERHGGKLWVESELGKGAIFYFSLPVHE